LAAAFDGERLYLGWGFGEGGWTEIAVDQKLTDDGSIRKFWGAGLSSVDQLWGLTALAVNEDYVFLARDGAFVEKIPEIIPAGISIVNRKDGSPANLPFGGQGGSRVLVMTRYPSKLIPPAKPLFELRKINSFGPQYQDLNLIAIAVSGDIIYGSLVHENKIVAFNWKTGQRAGEMVVQHPAGLQVRPDGKLVADGPNLVVADTRRHRVLWFSTGTRSFKGQLGQTDKPGASLATLDRPGCLAVRGDRLAVYDADNQRIIKATLRE